MKSGMCEQGGEEKQAIATTYQVAPKKDVLTEC